MMLFRRIHQPVIIVRASRYATFSTFGIRNCRDYIIQLRALLEINPSYQLTDSDISQICQAIAMESPAFEVAILLVNRMFQYTSVYLGLFERPLLELANCIGKFGSKLVKMVFALVHDSMDADFAAKFFNLLDLQILQNYEGAKSVLLIAATSSLLDYQKAAILLYKCYSIGIFIARAVEILLDSPEFRSIFDYNSDFFQEIYFFSFLDEMPNYFVYLLSQSDSWKFLKQDIIQGRTRVDEHIIYLLSLGDEECARICETCRLGSLYIDPLLSDF